MTSNLASEVSRATAAENAIAADLATETSNRIAAETVIEQNLTAEITRATTAENALGDAIDAEENRAVAAEGVLTVAISDDICRAPAGVPGKTLVIKHAKVGGAFDAADVVVRGNGGEMIDSEMSIELNEESALTLVYFGGMWQIV